MADLSAIAAQTDHPNQREPARATICRKPHAGGQVQHQQAFWIEPCNASTKRIAYLRNVVDDVVNHNDVKRFILLQGIGEIASPHRHPACRGPLHDRGVRLNAKNLEVVLRLVEKPTVRSSNIGDDRLGPESSRISCPMSRKFSVRRASSPASRPPSSTARCAPDH